MPTMSRSTITTQDFLKPMDVSQVTLADHLSIPVQRINELVRGKRGVTLETAWLLARALGFPTPPRAVAPSLR